MVKMYRTTAVMAVILVILIVLAIAQFVFRFSYQDLIYSNFWAFVFSLIAIAILSSVGAIFIGMYVSMKWLAQKSFTPFEEEMLKMRSDVKHIRDKVHELEQYHAGTTPETEKSSIGPDGTENVANK